MAVTDFVLCRQIGGLPTAISRIQTAPQMFLGLLELRRLEGLHSLPAGFYDISIEQWQVHKSFL